MRHRYGKTVVAYRGTDEGFRPPSPDAVHGYGVSLGVPTGGQATKALEFYAEVAGRTPDNANVIVTGAQTE